MYKRVSTALPSLEVGCWPQRATLCGHMLDAATWRRCLLRSAAFVRWGIRLDCASAWFWVAAQVLALWPHGGWMVRRMADRSDDPMGILALMAMGGLLWKYRRNLRAAPALAWLWGGMVLTVLATLALAWWPPLPCALVAVLALASTLRAFLPAAVATLPVAALAVLALPLLSSVQFYAGYPLRAITAEVSRWMLSPFFVVQREAATLWVNGQQVMVDAPCSGVQMAWFGYFTACVVALVGRLPQRDCILRLPLVGVLVLCGNVLRNSTLVVLEAAHVAPGESMHWLLGLVFLGAVCGAIACLMACAPSHLARCARAKEARHA